MKSGEEKENIHTCTTYWVEASVLPSGLKAAAIVDLGGGSRGQYLPDKCCKDSSSAL